MLKNLISKRCKMFPENMSIFSIVVRCLSDDQLSLQTNTSFYTYKQYYTFDNPYNKRRASPSSWSLNFASLSVISMQINILLTFQYILVFIPFKIVSGYILKALNIDLKLHEFILGIWSSTWWLLTSQQIKINILTIMSISLSSLVDSYFTHANISHHIFYFLFPYQKKYQIHYT